MDVGGKRILTARTRAACLKRLREQNTRTNTERRTCRTCGKVPEKLVWAGKVGDEQILLCAPCYDEVQG